MIVWVVYLMSSMVPPFQVCVRAITVIKSLPFVLYHLCISFSPTHQIPFFSVIWGHVSEEVAHAAKEDMISVKDELRNNQIKRWQAIGTLKHVLSFVSLPWDLKKHTVNFLLCITDGDVCRNCNEEYFEWSSYMPNLFSALQVLQFLTSICFSSLSLLLFQLGRYWLVLHF